jgi:hypothetical protein
MRREALEKLLEFQPELGPRRVKWRGNTVSVSALDGLHPDTTYVVNLKSGFRDAHNAASKEGFSFAFATSAAMDSGSIAGQINYRREPSTKARVRAFVLPKDSSFSVWSARPDREARVSPLGEYELRYLPTRDKKILVWAFEDANNDGNFNGDSEHSAAYADTIVLTAISAVAMGRDIWIVDPDEPGKVEGIVANLTGVDTLVVVVGLFQPGTGSAAEYLTICDSDGAFSFDGIHAGSYGMSAFVDLQADSACGTYPCAPDSTAICLEPCVAHPDSVLLDPGAKVVLSPVELYLPSEERE